MAKLLGKIEEWLMNEEKLLVGKSIFMMNFFKSDQNLQLFISMFTQPLTIKLGSYFKWSKYYNKNFPSTEDNRIQTLISKEPKMMRKVNKFVDKYRDGFRNYLRSFLVQKILENPRNYHLIKNLNQDFNEILCKGVWFLHLSFKLGKCIKE